MKFLFLLPFSFASLSFPYILTIEYVGIDALTKHPMWFHTALSEYIEALPTLNVPHDVLDTSLADKYSKLLCPAWDFPLMSSVFNYFYPKYLECDSFLRNLFVNRRFLYFFKVLNDILKPKGVQRTGVLLDYPLYFKKFEHISPLMSSVEHFLVYTLMSKVLGTYEELAPTYISSGYPHLLVTISQSFEKDSVQILERRFPLRKPTSHELQLAFTNDLLLVLYFNEQAFDDVHCRSIKETIKNATWDDSLAKNFARHFRLYAISCYYSLRRVVPDYTSYIQASKTLITEIIDDLIRQRSRHQTNRKVQMAYTKFMEASIICGLINNQCSIAEAITLDRKIGN